MAEKNILSRIQLRYDSYANWTSEALGDGKGAKLVLKAGEIGICSIPSGTNAEGIQNPPHVMMKVGDGTSAFSALPWVSAKAADVYTWAKQANLPVVAEGEGNVISSISWENNGLKIVKANVALASEFSSLADRVEAIENGYATDAELASAVETINAAIELKADKTYVDAELAKKVNTSDFNTFKTENTAAIGTAKDEAIAAAKTETESQVKALAEGAVADNAAAIEELEGVVADNKAAADTIGDRVTAIENAPYVKKSELDAVAEVANKAAIKTEVEAALALKADQTALEAEIARAGAAEKANADEIARVNGVLVNALENNAEGLDSIKELAAWIEEHGTDASEMAAAIEANAAAIEDIVDGTTVVAEATHAVSADKIGEIAAADVATQTYVNNAVAGEATARNEAIEEALSNFAANTEVAEAAHADVASELDASGIAQVKAIKVDNAAHADTADNATNADQLGGVPAANYATKDYADQAEADAITAANAYADSLADNYATAEQGDKADSALQSVTVGTGLTVSAKANNIQNIEIDETVIFVLNGGTASTVI